MANKVDKLSEVEFIREVINLNWLANIVLVQNQGASGGCVDFINLNKASLKDSFPLPWIDMLVDSTAGHKLLSSVFF